jgi:hypothetical protein
MEDVIFGKKINKFDEIFITRMLDKSWKDIIDNTIEWSAFYLANKERQKYEWNKMPHNEICMILSFEKKNFQVVYIMNIKN